MDDPQWNKNAWCTDTGPLAAIALTGILEVQFSLSGRYSVTYEPNSVTKHAEGSHSINVREPAPGEFKGTLIQKAYTDWALQWTNDG
ncbi:hypothetical protein GGI12_006023, partial [Dipsacomyces acuminosporus]